MENKLIKNFLNELPQMLNMELPGKLTQFLKEIRTYGVEKILTEYPDFFAQLMNQLKKRDPAEIFNEVPEAADLLLELLWEGVGHQAENLPTVQIVLNKLERIMRVNLEASDSPFKSHFIIQEAKIKGGSGLLHFQDEDFRFMGSTEVLIDLLLGDLHLGFSNLRLQTAGHSGWLSRLGPIMAQINKILKGEMA